LALHNLAFNRSCVGLKKLLSILHCRFVTPEGILSCLRFPAYLRRFETLTKTTRVPKSVVLQIGVQNPSLELLSSIFSFGVHFESVPLTLRKICLFVSAWFFRSPKLLQWLPLISRKGFGLSLRTIEDGAATANSETDFQRTISSVRLLQHTCKFETQRVVKTRASNLRVLFSCGMC